MSSKYFYKNGKYGPVFHILLTCFVIFSSFSNIFPRTFRKNLRTKIVCSTLLAAFLHAVFKFSGPRERRAGEKPLEKEERTGWKGEEKV
jgi:hypothetical protein